MDSDHFDALSRALYTRRHVVTRTAGFAAATLAAVLGLGHPHEAEAKCKKPCGPCKRCKQGKCKPKPAGTACAGGTCQGGSCLPAACFSQDPALVCAAGCGVKADNCGRAVTCPCPAGQTCLANGTCAGTCNSDADTCPSGCVCSALPSVEGAFRCVPKLTSCNQIPQACTRTAECPQGQHCQITVCGTFGGAPNRCFPLCSG
jgi:hypothetical protein